MKKPHAQIEWRDNQPFASEYQDVYFSTDSGLAETEYVFLAHNQLKSRWRNLTQSHFSLCETGFGTGLNFLSTWKLWRESAPQNARLHFISTEKHPLNLDDLTKSLSLWPSLADLSAKLIQQYPCVSEGWHRMVFDDGQVSLTLIIGDINETLPLLNGKIDAWFLDGFSPAKNPDMWQDNLFKQMANRSHQSTTFATFTSASSIRRGLANVGFQVNKAPGFGKKREMLYGHFLGPEEPIQAIHQNKTVIVIGGGLSGASSAEAMARRGYKVKLIERHHALAQEASGNPLGVLYPRLTGGKNSLNTLALQGFLYTLGRLKSFHLSDQNYQSCGVLQLGFNSRELQRIDAVSNQYPNLVQYVTRDTASEISGAMIVNDGLFIPQAGWVNPAAFCEVMTQNTNIERLFNLEALSLKKNNQRWQVCTSSKVIAEADFIIIACALDAQNFEQTRHCEMQAVRGQVTLFPANQHTKDLKTVVCADGYLSPAIQGQHCLGATFSPNDNLTDIREVDHETNLDMLSNLVPSWASAINMKQPLQGRASVRATTMDYLPHAGAVLDVGQLQDKPPRHNASPKNLPWLKGLFINAGHGAKGLVNAPLSAEIVASLICDEPAPVDDHLLSALDPNRFILRAMGLKRLAQTIQAN